MFRLRGVPFLILILFWPFSAPAHSLDCTSFLLRTEQGLFFVHSLNQGDWESVPGLVFLNQRGVWKRGFSLESFLRADGRMEASLAWRARYGSVTFNPSGRDLPDGGMNEEGLFIWEHTLVGTEFPDRPNQPKLFMMQWMQYVLDNFSTVDEVIANTERVSIDGWEWHFFVADASGKTAVIEFLEGRPIIHTGESMPVPLVANSVYSQAVEWLELHEGFGGSAPVHQSLREFPRFIYGAKILQEYLDQDPVEYSFGILEAMSQSVRWSIAFDVSRSRVYFKTNVNEELRWFDFGPEDFGGEGDPLAMDIDSGREDVKTRFLPFSEDQEREPMEALLGALMRNPGRRSRVLYEQNLEVGGLIENIQQKRGGDFHFDSSPLAGRWTGRVNYPAGRDNFQEVEMTLNLRQEGDSLWGHVTDGGPLSEVPIRDAIFEAGLLRFLISVPGRPELLHYKLHFTGNTIRGAVHILGDPRSAPLILTRESGSVVGAPIPMDYEPRVGEPLRFMDPRGRPYGSERARLS